MRRRSLTDPVVRRLIRARDVVEASYAEPLSLDELARAAGLSRFHFQRSFRATFGRTPHAYLTEVRLARAKEALARGESVTDTCFDVGFSSLGSFSTLFARESGVSPRAWQRRVRTVVSVPDLVRRIWMPT